MNPSDGLSRGMSRLSSPVDLAVEPVVSFSVSSQVV